MAELAFVLAPLDFRTVHLLASRSNQELHLGYFKYAETYGLSTYQAAAFVSCGRLPGKAGTLADVPVQGPERQAVPVP